MSFANECMKNYSKGNTVHCLILGQGKSTISLFPVEASKIESAFDKCIKNYYNKYHTDPLDYISANH